jgi:hypothetical protein
VSFACTIEKAISTRVVLKVYYYVQCVAKIFGLSYHIKQDWKIMFEKNGTRIFIHFCILLGSFEFFAKNKTKNGPENFFARKRSEKKAIPLC